MNGALGQGHACPCRMELSDTADREHKRLQARLAPSPSVQEDVSEQCTLCIHAVSHDWQYADACVLLSVADRFKARQKQVVPKRTGSYSP